MVAEAITGTPVLFTQATSSSRHKPVPVIVKNATEDKKLTTDHVGRPVATTYVSQWSCPASCVFLKSVDPDTGAESRGPCYSEQGNMGFVTARLNSSGYRPAAELAQLEAEGIRKLPGYHPLRLHVVGDTTDNPSARIVSDACADYQRKHDAPVWTYTHAWRMVDRVSWQAVSVLASCETPADVAAAHARGYAAERTVTEWEDAQPVTLADGRTLKPFKCPQQLGYQPDCEACGFCARDTAWRDTAYLVLKAHGATRKLRAVLERANASP